MLVNNAGYGYLAAVEEGEEKDVRVAIFETNFFGLAAMIRAVLPGMRARRHGFIVNIASVGGTVGPAGSGYYSATKFAVEGPVGGPRTGGRAARDMRADRRTRPVSDEFRAIRETIAQRHR